MLRNDLDLHGPRFGCGLGQCSVCTVIIDGNGRALLHHAGIGGARARSRRSKASRRTAQLHPLQQAWIDEQAAQCGYCQNGQIMTAKALLDRNPNPTDAEIRAAMDGALCRLHDVLPRAGGHQAASCSGKAAAETK